MQDQVAKLNDQGISTCMIQGHVLHKTMMMAAISNNHWIDLSTQRISCSIWPRNVCL